MDKKAAIRRQVIDRMLGNKYNPFPTKEQMRQECEEVLYGSQSGKNVSISIIEKDMRYMKDYYEAPIDYDAFQKGYYYINPRYSMGLTEDEYESIHLASRILDQFKDTEIFEDFDGVVEKILERVNLSFKNNEKDSREYVQFETAPLVLGTEHLSPLLSAIKNKQSISFAYKKFNTEEVKTHYLDPYLLKEYRNRWYLIGYKKESDYIYTFGLGRLSKLVVLSDKFNVSPRFNLYKFYQHNIGITTVKEKPQKIVIEVSARQSEYVISQPLHSSQKEVSRNNKYVTFELKVVPTYELEQLILGMGNEVLVIAPESLRNSVKLKLTKLIEKYND